MEADKEVYRAREHNNQPFIWMLTKKSAAEMGVAPVDFPQNFYTRKHEVDLADVFVACYPHVTHWDTEWGTLEREALRIPHYRVNYDARMVVKGRVYLWEIDRGTEDVEKQLAPKIKKYIDFSDSLGAEETPFQVIFTLQKYRKLSLGNRADRLLDLLASKKRRNQFLVAKHSDVLTDPLGPVYVSPLDPMTKRHLSDLT